MLHGLEHLEDVSQTITKGILVQSGPPTSQGRRGPELPFIAHRIHGTVYYLPTVSLKFMVNVGKYTIHGASG